MAEHSYFPRTFGVHPGMSPNAEGGQTPVMELRFLDSGGDVVKIVLGLPDWEQFQAAVADPGAFAKRMREQAAAAEARSKIVLAGTGLGPQPGQKRRH